MDAFAARLLDWFDQHGRHDLPWQKDTTPYRVWVSEIMLQQTQVATVIPYYQRFMKRFPHVSALAEAPIDDVLHHWSGLGYYARARNLHRAATVIVTEWGGEFPKSQKALESLPGIGRSTAAAIRSLALGQPAAILDGNVKRVLSRYHAVEGWPGTSAMARRLWSYAESHTPTERPAAYTQAIMDLGATLCTSKQPACTLCPLAEDCAAAALGRQDAFPGRKPKKERPVRFRRVLIAQDAEGSVLLERRPSSGIWGGLWSLPELEDEECAEQWCHRRLNMKIISSAELEPINHTFTHFELVMKPAGLRLAGIEGQVSDATDRIWYRLADGQGQAVGLPAPVRTLLNRLRNSDMM